MKQIFSFFLLLLTIFTIPAYAEYFEEEEYSEEQLKTIRFYESLDWKASETLELPQSNATLRIPEEFAALTGDDARKLDTFWNGASYARVEAIIKSDDGTDALLFSYENDGYVSIDDWEQIDPKELLQSIRDGTEESNLARKENGISPIHTIGWVEEPYLDRETNTVHWVTELEDEEGVIPFVNATALKLGRRGYERIVWVTDKPSFLYGDTEFSSLLSMFDYQTGDRYADYSHGDKIASYGIAALVATSAGAKLLKSTGLLLVLKKFGVYIFAGFSAIIYKLKAWFKRK